MMADTPWYFRILRCVECGKRTCRPPLSTRPCAHCALDGIEGRLEYVEVAD